MSKTSKKVSILGRVNDDPFFRYKRSEIECRTKFTITYITNIYDIADDLKTEVSYLVKHFGQDLNTLSKLIEKNEELQLNGLHPLDKLDASLQKFIDVYILCQKCQLPELKYVAKKDFLGAKCHACGHRTKYPNDRLTKFMKQNLKSCSTTKKRNDDFDKEKKDENNNDDLLLLPTD